MQAITYNYDSLNRLTRVEYSNGEFINYNYDNADLDDDNDGIPDLFEIANGLDPLDNSDALADTEGDGFSNLVEYQAASDINDSDSLPVFLDSDNDGILDHEDNCLDVKNSLQKDTDNDGYGNRCDADFNNDDIVNFSDLGQFRQLFNTANQDADFNGDGIVDFGDLAIFRSLFNKPADPRTGL